MSREFSTECQWRNCSDTIKKNGFCSCVMVTLPSSKNDLLSITGAKFPMVRIKNIFLGGMLFSYSKGRERPPSSSEWVK